MPTIVLYKDFLKSGRGADRATAMLLNELAKRGYTLHLITQHCLNEPFSVTLDPAIQCHTLTPPKFNGLKRFINKRLLCCAWGERFLRHFLPQCDITLQTHRRLRVLLTSLNPDIILSAGSNETIELCAEGTLPAPLLQLFHIFPLDAFKKNKYQRAARFKRALRTQVKACQVLLPSHAKALQPYTNASLHIIGNPIAPPPAHIPHLSANQRSKTLVYIAYFSKDKNHLSLIKAFAQTRAAQKGWRLQLYGSGTPTWEARLKACASAHKVADIIDFMGVTTTTYEILSQASICAYPSLTEGFGMALAEAMICGCACIGFRQASGVNELITNNLTGRLVDETPAAFAAAIDELAFNPEQRQRFADAAEHAIKAYYAPDTIWQAWESLLQSLHH